MLMKNLGKLKVGEYFFEVPVNYSEPGEDSLRLFARSIRRVPDSADSEGEDKPLPWLLFLTGGPGFGCYPPQNSPWSRLILDRGYEVRWAHVLTYTIHDYHDRELRLILRYRSFSLISEEQVSANLSQPEL